MGQWHCRTLDVLTHSNSETWRATPPPIKRKSSHRFVNAIFP